MFVVNISSNEISKVPHKNDPSDEKCTKISIELRRKG